MTLAKELFESAKTECSLFLSIQTEKGYSTNQTNDESLDTQYESEKDEGFTMVYDSEDDEHPSEIIFDSEELAQVNSQ